MPIFQLSEEIKFPPVDLADPDGILAVGGDLSAERLIQAYSKGIFPWYSEGQPIIWWSPDPRMVLFPENIRISKSMRPLLNQEKYRVTFDQDFLGVITACEKIRGVNRTSTWITAEMRAAYIHLHHIGLAHSVEVWEDEQVVGGLYGVSLGSCFFGESMFSRKSNASKFGFIRLVQQIAEMGFDMVDCQVYTEHLESLGASEIPREEFIESLEVSLQNPTLQGNWQDHFNS